MERDFYNEEFEDLIREKTDQYKMYPSDKVWKGIYASLHTRKRRFVLGMSVLISGILIIAGRELLWTGRRPAAEKLPQKIAVPEIGTDDLPAGNVAAFEKSAAFHHALIPTLTGQTDEKLPVPQEPWAAISMMDVAAASPSPAAPSSGAGSPGERSLTTLELVSAIRPTTSLNAEVTAPEQVAATAPTLENAAEALALQRISADDKRQMAWLRERATQHLSPPKKHKIGWQIYFTPTVNYRKLSGGNFADSRSTVQNVPISLIHYGSANDFVDHTPAVGYEIGGSFLYRVTRNLTLKAGLQFDYSSYFIRAYSSSPELATIALNPYYGYYADSITAYSSLRNFGGKSKENLQNRYYQLSVPLGFEMRVLGNGKLQLHVGGTIQPTYLLNKNNYLLTTDYAYYTKEPSLFRRWNLNGGLEAFFSYQIGGLRWQIGPQFRYQLLSTYTGNYPLKENLMEYGIKIGISKFIP